MKIRLLSMIILIVIVLVACSPELPAASLSAVGLGMAAVTRPDAPLVNVMAAPTAFPTQPRMKPTAILPTATPPEGGEGGDGTGGADYFTEEFTSEPDGWKLSFVTGSEVLYDWYWEDDRLKIEIPVYPNDVYMYYSNMNAVFNDVLVQAEVENKAGSNYHYAVTCRMTERGWYEFRVSPMQKYALYQYDQRLKEKHKNPYVFLAEATHRDINPGKAVNKIGLQCKGTSLRMFVNETEMIFKKRVINDDKFDSGNVGVGVMTYPETRSKVEVEFINASASEPIME